MLKHFFSLRRWPTRLYLVLALVACLSWLALCCKRHPYGSGSANRKIVREAPSAKEGHTQLSEQTGAAPQMTQTNALQYLAETGDGQSLAAAISEAEYAINRIERPSAAPDADLYEASNPEQALQVLFANNRVDVRSTDEQKWQLGLQLKGYGYGNQLDAAPPITSRRVKGNRIEYE